jgi:hypothetical protein
MAMQFQMHMCSVIVFTPTRSEMRAATGHIGCIRAGKSLGENQLCLNYFGSLVNRSYLPGSTNWRRRNSPLRVKTCGTQHALACNGAVRAWS